MLSELEKAVRCRTVAAEDTPVDESPLRFSFLPPAGTAPDFPVFHLRNRLGQDTDAAGDTGLVRLFEGVVKAGGKTTHTFAFPGTASLREVVSRLASTRQVLFLAGRRIFLDKTDTAFLGSIVSVVRAGACETRDISTKLRDLGLVLGSSLVFFDGKRRLKISVTRHSVVYGSRARLFLNSLERKSPFCKVCAKGRVEISVEDDPVLPGRKKFLCRECFDLLFVDPDGSPKYPGMQHSAC